MKKNIALLVLLFVSQLVTGQKSKVQTAWRALSDYEETLKEGRPEVSYLTKAKEAVDAAIANPDTKNSTKAHAYKLRINYALFQSALAEQVKLLEPTMGDKNERVLAAYGKTNLENFETAANELNTIRDLDPKFLETIQTGLANGAGNLEEDELKFALAVQQMKIESANIASGKYKNQNYGEAADYFYKTAVMNSILYKTMDTANFYNACVSASKSKDNNRVVDYNKKMIDARISSPYNYDALQTAALAKGDTVAALDYLKKGRGLYPGDVALLTQETNLFLAMGRQQDALNNLKVSVEKDPSNALYYFIIGNIYDNLANPKDKASGQELPKPANFDELFKNAEINYLKAIALKPKNQEHLYNSYYNLGAMYNNYGGYVANSKSAKGMKDAELQKENEKKATDFYNKAIPNLEQAFAIKSDDRQTMIALRKLYLLTGNTAKAQEMSDRIKKAGG
jgi:hypothetical protein